MTCYYPLLGLSQGIVSSLTYSGHTLNQRTGGELRSQLHSVDLALYGLRGQGWTCLDRIPLPVTGDLTVTSSDYGLQPGELLVGVPLARQEVPDPSDPLLPRPYSKKVDRSPVAERCSLGFRWRGVASSYQGEYPLRMAAMERGTLLTFDPLLQSGPTVGMNLLCLVTLCRSGEERSHRLEGFDALTGQRRFSTAYRSNSCCLVEIEPQEAARGELFCRSTTSLGIPIYITLSRHDLPASMSVEHTHPPTELFSERDRLRGSRAIKSSWLGLSVS
jgi:hypothetical protein